MFDDVNNDNYMLYAIKAYEKPNCIQSEFYEDFKRFNYVKRLLFRYCKSGNLKHRLLLNHLIVIYNLFGVEPATRLLFFFMEEKNYPALKTFLLFLSYMPERIKVKGKIINSSDIQIDFTVANILREIK